MEVRKTFTKNKKEDMKSKNKAKTSRPKDGA
jgi:hypothetical protein